MTRPLTINSDGRIDDAVEPVLILLDVKGHLPGGQHPRSQTGLVLPGDVGASNRSAGD